MSENNSSLVGWFLDDKKKSFFWSFITSWLIVNWEVVLYLIFDAKVAEAKILAIKSLMHIDGEFFAFLKIQSGFYFLLFYELFLPAILTLIRMFIFSSLAFAIEWGVKKWEDFISSNEDAKGIIVNNLFIFLFLLFVVHVGNCFIFPFINEERFPSYLLRFFITFISLIIPYTFGLFFGYIRYKVLKKINKAN